MRTHLIGLALLSICFIVSCSDLAAEQAGDRTAAIGRLVEQLGDKNFRIRQAAGRALEDFGDEALPTLRGVLDSSDEEVRRRAEVLVQKIERNALLSPKRVSISMKDRSIEDVVKELARQSGYKLQYQGGQPRKISIDLQNVSYWQALEKICNDGHLSPGFDDQQGIVYLYQQNTISPYTHHAGPFRVVAQNFNYSRYINLSNIPRNGSDPNSNPYDNSLNFGFLIQSEPKVPILAIGLPKLTRAEDENGVSLLPRLHEDSQANVAFYEGNGMYRNFQHSTGVAMAKPAKDAATAKVIKGKVAVTLLASTKPDVVIDKIAPGKKKLTGTGQSAEIEIEEITEQNKVWMITMIVKRQLRNGEAQDFNWMNSVPQKLELYDEKGQKFQSQGVTNFINNTPGSVHATYQFAPLNNATMGKATKLVLVEWLTLQHEVEFEFKDLPLP